MTKKKKRNPADLTKRNNEARKKEIKKLKEQIENLKEQVRLLIRRGVK